MRYEGHPPRHVSRDIAAVATSRDTGGHRHGGEVEVHRQLWVHDGPISSAMTRSEARCSTGAVAVRLDGQVSEVTTASPHRRPE